MFGSFRDLAFLGAAAGSGVALDPDAQAYITAVETVDGQSLEAGVRTAINDFVVGCKADGIWTAIKASCIMAGARTRLGAMVPLVGAAPTSFNFVDADYNRKTGLAGDGSTKHLDSNYMLTSTLQNNAHLSAFLSTVPTTGRSLIAADLLVLFWNDLIRLNAGGGTDFVPASNASGFKGASRSASSGFTYRRNSASTAVTQLSTGTINTTLAVFARKTGSSYGFHSNARLAFYSIGESLDLALLDARVTDLINAFGAAIP
jgi:hypothetical protein